MMEKELLQQLKELKEIKPRKDWVVLTKSRIFGRDSAVEVRLHFPVFQWKLAFAPIISVFIVIGLFGFAEKTVPGDFLFSVKKITETVQVGLSSAVEKPGVNLKIANKRLKELGEIAEANNVRSLGPAIEEFQTTLSEATKGLVAMDANVTSSDDPFVLKEILQESQKLEEKKQEIETVLGAKIGNTDELENALSNLEKRTADYLIGDLERRTLDKQDEILLKEAKKASELGNYSLALEKLWLLSNR